MTNIFKRLIDTQSLLIKRISKNEFTDEDIDTLDNVQFCIKIEIDKILRKQEDLDIK